jgi:1-deoxy-D-xylulose-5-phosphate synthase
MTDYPVLDKIKKENDIKKLPENEWSELAREIRCFLTENVSKTGGHLSSNLGVVELTMALHLFLDLPEDKLVFDVGHQTYVHKILTGRKNFETLRQKGGLSGFPKGSESECDAFDTGHSSTSLSLASGLVTARELKGEKNKIVAVIGDGALGGGMAIEALNNIGKFKSNLIIILNDNEMSIDRNVGGMANYLGQIRTKKTYVNFKSGLENILDEIPGGSGERIVGRLKHIKDSLKTFFVSGMFFEDLGITYIGPINGHDVHQVLTALKSAARVDKPVLIHAVTQKGRGYLPAEKRPGKFHGIGPFDLKTGKILKKPETKTFTESFSEAMVELGDRDSRLIGITAAMEFGTGLREFGECHPDRFFDVGIAEQHAVTFAAALAKSGFRPVVAIYSTFLQRSYDQILHDVCLTKQPVIFMIDRGGITGEDGETHQGIFDLSYLSHIPGLTVMAPKNCHELKSMLSFSLEMNAPVAIRYPKCGESERAAALDCDEIRYGEAEKLLEGKDVAIFAVGTMTDLGLELSEMLKKDGFGTLLYNARFVNPIDKTAVLDAAKRCRVVVTLEENVKRGGFGEAVADLILENGLKTGFVNGSLKDSFIEHGKRSELLKAYGLDADEIYGKIRRIIG